MLEKIKAFFHDLAAGHRRPRFAEDDHRLAAAALMVHVVGVDGAVTAAERRRLEEVLRDRFGLDEAGVAALIAAATEIEGEAVDFYAFTSRLNRALDLEERKRIVEMLWQMTYADGRVNEFEDSVIWRVADLIGVSGHDRLALRRQVARRGGAEG